MKCLKFEKFGYYVIELRVCIMIHQNNQIHNMELNSYLDAPD